jgi:hypothetical protein
MQKAVSDEHKAKETTGLLACILLFMLLDSTREDKRFWTEWRQAFPELDLL